MKPKDLKLSSQTGNERVVHELGLGSLMNEGRKGPEPRPQFGGYRGMGG
jgi:hypothetical protein